MQYDVVCVGFVNQDIVLKGIDKGALERDSTHAESTLTAVGGDAANQAVVLSKLGNRGGIIAYILLFTITYFFLKRQVTTELFLIIGWAVLELSVINTLYKTEYFSFGGAVAFCIITAAAVLISLLCYISYYKLEKTAAGAAAARQICQRTADRIPRYGTGLQ